MSAQRTGAVPNSLTIGQVLAQLRIQFPELTSTKLRYFGDEGLVSPERRESGYRAYSPEDVQRLRIILSLQRDYFMPLKVIAQVLEDIDAGKRPKLPGGNEVTVDSILSLEVRVTKKELLEMTSASSSLLAEATTHGLIKAGNFFGEDAVKTLSALVQLGKAGIEPRHLKNLKAQAEKDANILVSAVIPISKAASRVSRQKAIEAARELATNLEQVRLQVMMSAVEGSVE